MPRFVCNHNATAIQKIVAPSGRVLAFERGVLDTDEEGAAAIRNHPLYGRTILDGDESVPAHGSVPAAVAVIAAPMTPESEAMANTFYCSDCETTFANKTQYRRHMKKTHGEEGG